MSSATVGNDSPLSRPRIEWKKLILPVCALTPVLVFALLGLKSWQTRSALSRGQALLSEGKGALAAEALEPVRGALAGSPEGCRAMLAAFEAARDLPKLQWASEVCIQSGQALVEAYRGASVARQVAGDDEHALEVLFAGLGSLGPQAALYIEVVGILERNKNEAVALQSLSQALGRLPADAALRSYALRFYVRKNLWAQAKSIAALLDLFQPSMDPELRMTAARAYFKTGDGLFAENLARKTLQDAIQAKVNEQILTRLRDQAEELLVAQIGDNPRKLSEVSTLLNRPVTQSRLHKK